MNTEFNAIMCHSIDPEKPLAIGSIFEGGDTKRYYLYRDGRMEPIEQ